MSAVRNSILIARETQRLSVALSYRKQVGIYLFPPPALFPSSPEQLMTAASCLGSRRPQTSPTRMRRIHGAIWIGRSSGAGTV